MKKSSKKCSHCGSSKCSCKKMKTGGVVMRGAGAAKRGKTCRGPMA